MNKEMKTYRLHQRTIDLIYFISKWENMTQTEVIEKAIKLLNCVLRDSDPEEEYATEEMNKCCKRLLREIDIDIKK